MKMTARIGHAQLLMLTSTYTETALVVLLLTPIIRAGGPDAWIAPILGTLGGGVPVVVMLGILARQHPHKSFVTIAEECLGKWPGKAVGLFLAGFSLFIASLVTRDVIDFTAVSMLPHTPVLAIGLLFAGTLGYAAIQGGEVVGRLGAFIFIIKALAVLLIPLALVGEMEMAYVRPLAGKGWTPVLAATWPTLGWFGQTLVLAAFVPLLDKPKQAISALLWGLLWSLLVIEGLLIFSLMTFGSDLAGRFTFPAYALVQQLSIGMFAERMEIVLITVWLLGMVVKGAIALWAASITFAQTFSLNSDRYVAFPMAGFALGLIYMWPSVTSLLRFSTVVWTPIALPFELGIPALLVIISWWRTRRRQQGAAA